MVFNISPSYLCSLVPANVGQITNYNLRNTNALRSIPCKSQLYFNSLLPKTVRAWNDLPNELKSATTLDSFKERLNKSVKKTPKHFYTGQRSLQIYHSRLRTKSP